MKDAEPNEEPKALVKSETVVLAELETKRAELWTSALEAMAFCGLLAVSCSVICG